MAVTSNRVHGCSRRLSHDQTWGMRHRCGVCDELERHRQWPCSEAVAQDRFRHTAIGHILVAHNEKYLRHKKDCGSEFETMTISRS